jgi:Ca-activated chloride channel homolog
VVAELSTIAVIILAIGAEFLHASRCKRIASLAFGPKKRSAYWVFVAPPFRVISFGLLSWGLLTLTQLEPKIHRAQTIKEGEYKHVMLVLDVSPSIRLIDAGPEHNKSRMARAREVMESFFKRVPMQQYRVSVVAVYNEAKPVVIDTKDIDVVRNILGDLPMHYAFQKGETDLFAGLKQAIEIVKPWKPRSTTLILLSDGDTVPSTGMPKMPASVGHVLVIGVGDATKGSFIEGHQSRQDTATLRQIAVRLGGTYHNGNETHLATSTLKSLTAAEGGSKFEKLTMREYALIAIAVGAVILALLPMLLHFVGTSWKPGVQASSN